MSAQVNTIDQAQEPVSSSDGRTTRVHEAFNFGDSDVTLRSSDGVLFKLHKSHLAAHSVFFKGMFDCGTPTAPELARGVPVSETAATLGVLLPMCYPAPATGPPPIDLDALNHDQLLCCYEASCKYDMWMVSQLLRRILLPLVSKDPFRLVCVAVAVRDRDLQNRAAAATLSIDILQNVDEHREKAGCAWPALLEYHMRSKAEVQEFMRNELACTSGSHSARKIPCRNTLCDEQYNQSTSGLAAQKARHARELDWEMLRWKLANKSTGELPKAELLQFIERMLDDNNVRNCAGCRSTWQAKRLSVYSFRPNCAFSL